MSQMPGGSIWVILCIKSSPPSYFLCCAVGIRCGSISTSPPQWAGRPRLMSYEYRIIPEEDLLIITGSGTVSSDDLYRVVTAFQKHPAWRPSMKMLVDWRHVTELDVDEEGV